MRVETGFIEPMQCKPVAAMPAGEKWVFELKLDGYRCIAVKDGKEVTLFSRHRKVLNRRFPGVVDALTRLTATLFSTENLSPWIHKADPHSNSYKTLFHSRFLPMFTPLIY